MFRYKKTNLLLPDSTVSYFFFVLGQQRYARIPDWMENSGNTNRIVGGQKALEPIPWQVGF